MNGKNDAAKVQTAEVPESLPQNPESRKINENAADINIDGIQRVETINTAGGSTKRNAAQDTAKQRKISGTGQIRKFSRNTRKM